MLSPKCSVCNGKKLRFIKEQEGEMTWMHFTNKLKRISYSIK